MYPGNKTRWANVVLMLNQRLRRWSNIRPTLVQSRMLHINPCPAEFCLFLFFVHLKLRLLITQCPASKEEKYHIFEKQNLPKLNYLNN